MPLGKLNRQQLKDDVDNNLLTDTKNRVDNIRTRLKNDIQWNFKPEYDPLDEGIIFDGVTDQGSVFNTFLSDIRTLPYSTIRIAGKLATSIPIVWTGNGVNSAPRNFICDLEIVALGAINDYILKFTNQQLANFRGRIKIVGTGSASYATRTCKDGILITQCARSSWQNISVENVQRWGVVIDSTVSGNTDNLKIDRIKTTNCGSGVKGTTREITGTWGSKIDSGSSGSTGQRSQITITGFTPPTDSGYFANIDNALHYVTGVSGQNLTLYPWINLASSSGNASIYYGGGVKFAGVESNIHDMGLIDSGNCGVAVNYGSLYGGKTNALISQADAICTVFGSGISSTNHGCVIDNIQSVTNDFDIIQLTDRDIGARILSLNATSLSKSLAFAPRLSPGNTLSDTYQRFRGLELSPSPLVSSPHRGDGIVKSTYLHYNPDLPNNTVSGTITVMAGPIGSSEQHIKSDGPTTIKLKISSDEHRLFGYSFIKVYAIGTGTRKEPTGTYTIQADNGAHGINGGSPGGTLALTFRVPTWIYALYDGGTNWNVTTSEAPIDDWQSMTDNISDGMPGNFIIDYISQGNKNFTPRASLSNGVEFKFADFAGYLNNTGDSFTFKTGAGGSYRLKGSTIAGDYVIAKLDPGKVHRIVKRSSTLYDIEVAGQPIKPYLYEPEDYNIVGDGVTNVTTAFQNMVNAAATDGRPLFLDPSKVYVVSSITWPVGLKLDGNGAEILQLPGVSNFTRLFTRIGASPLTQDRFLGNLKNITLNGNKQNQGTYLGGEKGQNALIFLQGDITTPYRDRFELSNVLFKNSTGDGIHQRMNTDIYGKDIQGIGNYRRTLTITGGWARGNYINVRCRKDDGEPQTTDGIEDGLQVEVDAVGWAGSQRYDLTLIDFEGEAFELECRSGSIVNIINPNVTKYTWMFGDYYDVQIFDNSQLTAGVIDFTFRGQTTNPIPYNADAATIEAELLALSTIGYVSVVDVNLPPLPGSGSLRVGKAIRFGLGATSGAGFQRNQLLPLIEVDLASATGTAKLYSIEGKPILNVEGGKLCTTNINFQNEIRNILNGKFTNVEYCLIDNAGNANPRACYITHAATGTPVDCYVEFDTCVFSNNDSVPTAINGTTSASGVWISPQSDIRKTNTVFRSCRYTGFNYGIVMDRSGTVEVYDPVFGEDIITAGIWASLVKDGTYNNRLVIGGEVRKEGSTTGWKYAKLNGSGGAIVEHKNAIMQKEVAAWTVISTLNGLKPTGWRTIFADVAPTVSDSCFNNDRWVVRPLGDATGNEMTFIADNTSLSSARWRPEQGWRRILNSITNFAPGKWKIDVQLIGNVNVTPISIAGDETVWEIIDTQNFLNTTDKVTFITGGTYVIDNVSTTGDYVLDRPYGHVTISKIGATSYNVVEHDKEKQYRHNTVWSAVDGSSTATLTKTEKITTLGYRASRSTTAGPGNHTRWNVGTVNDQTYLDIEYEILKADFTSDLARCEFTIANGVGNLVFRLTNAGVGSIQTQTQAIGEIVYVVDRGNAWGFRVKGYLEPNVGNKIFSNLLPAGVGGNGGLTYAFTIHDIGLVDEATSPVTFKTFDNLDATPSVSGGFSVFEFNNSGAITVTNFDDGVKGQHIVVLMDANTTIQNNANIQLFDGKDRVAGAQKVIQFVQDDASIWKEQGYFPRLPRVANRFFLQSSTATIANSEEISVLNMRYTKATANSNGQHATYELSDNSFNSEYIDLELAFRKASLTATTLTFEVRDNTSFITYEITVATGAIAIIATSSSGVLAAAGSILSHYDNGTERIYRVQNWLSGDGDVNLRIYPGTASGTGAAEYAFRMLDVGDTSRKQIFFGTSAPTGKRYSIWNDTSATGGLRRWLGTSWSNPIAREESAYLEGDVTSFTLSTTKQVLVNWTTGGSKGTFAAPNQTTGVITANTNGRHRITFSIIGVQGNTTANQIIRVYLRITNGGADDGDYLIGVMHVVTSVGLNRVITGNYVFPAQFASEEFSLVMDASANLGTFDMTRAAFEVRQL